MAVTSPSTDSLISAILFDATGKPLITQPYSEVKEAFHITEQSWFQQATRVIENVHISLPHVQDMYVNPSGSERWVISVSRAVELTQSGTVSQGVLLLDLDFSSITQILRNANTGLGAYLYICDRNGELLYHPRLSLLASGLDSEESLDYATMDDAVYMDANDNQIISVQTVGYTGWKMILVTPSQHTITGAQELQAFTMLFMLIAIALIILVNFLISTGIAQPIKELEDQVFAYEKGELQHFAEDSTGPPEITHLRSAIQSFIIQQEELRQDIIHEQEEKRRSELEALQAQIHPHFLYNTLDSIVWMVENERYDGAVEMVTALARFFRLSLAKGKSITTISKELDHVRYYLRIQQIRFRNQFIYTITVEPEIAECLTFKLIVQLLVENAVYHGTSSLEEDGLISIRAYSHGELIHIDVEDNGLGMSAELQEHVALRMASAHSSQTGSGIGVANVDERIKLFFGQDYGLEIFSEPDEGTLVRITIPKRTEEGELK